MSLVEHSEDLHVGWRYCMYYRKLNGDVKNNAGIAFRFNAKDDCCCDLEHLKNQLMKLPAYDFDKKAFLSVYRLMNQILEGYTDKHKDPIIYIECSDAYDEESLYFPKWCVRVIKVPSEKSWEFRLKRKRPICSEYRRDLNWENFLEFINKAYESSTEIERTGSTTV